MIADPRLDSTSLTTGREDDEKGCGVFKGRSPLGEGVMEDLAWKGDNRPRLQSGGGFPRPLHLDKFPNFIFFYFWEIILSIRKDSMIVRAPNVGILW